MVTLCDQCPMLDVDSFEAVRRLSFGLLDHGDVSHDEALCGNASRTCLRVRKGLSITSDFARLRVGFGAIRCKTRVLAYAPLHRGKTGVNVLVMFTNVLWHA